MTWIDIDADRCAMPDFKAVNALFYNFHSELEAIVMDMVGEKINKRTLDTMFEDFDSLQEEYHNKLAEWKTYRPQSPP